jgi:hypothetical protein
MRRGQGRTRSERGQPPVLRRRGTSGVQRRLTGAVVEVQAALEPWKSWRRMALTRQSQGPLTRTGMFVLAKPRPAMQRGKPPVLRRGRTSRFRADRGEPSRVERTLKGAAERSNRTLAGAAERWRGQRSGAVLQLTALPWSRLEVPSEPPALQAQPVEEEPAAREPVPTTAVAVPVPSRRCANRWT